MTCPFCGHKEDRVIDSRESKEGDVIRRRRQCLPAANGGSLPTNVATKSRTWSSKRTGGERSSTARRFWPGFSGPARSARSRWGAGRAGRPGGNPFVGERRTGRLLLQRSGRCSWSGSAVLDKIAYVRFASVYRDFQDVEAFLDELKGLDSPQAAVRMTQFSNVRSSGVQTRKFPVTKRIRVHLLNRDLTSLASCYNRGRPPARRSVF